MSRSIVFLLSLLTTKADAGKNQRGRDHAHPRTGFKDVADDLTDPERQRREQDRAGVAARA